MAYRMNYKIISEGHEYGEAQARLKMLGSLTCLEDVNAFEQKMSVECTTEHTFTSRMAFATHWVFEDGSILYYSDFNLEYGQGKPDDEEEVKSMIAQEKEQERKFIAGEIE